MLFRLWTEEPAPYWKKDVGFASAPDPPPEIFGPARGPWLALRLKEPSADPELLEAQFCLFRETERARREKLLRRAEALNAIGTVIAALLFFFAIGVLFWCVRQTKIGQGDGPGKRVFSDSLLLRSKFVHCAWMR